jgi:alkylation response protein AidB-like acyl-CoA dehydrogenase
MIDLSLTREQKTFLDSAREFSKQEIQPIDLEYDEKGIYPEGSRRSIEAATGKMFATDAAMKITTDAVQIFAGSGYMKGAVVEKLFRDAKLLQILEGTNQINRVVAGRGLLVGTSFLF